MINCGTNHKKFYFSMYQPQHFTDSKEKKKKERKKEKKRKENTGVVGDIKTEP